MTRACWLAGTVLEIGPGHGSTLPYVRSAIEDSRIQKYVFFEPNQAMHGKLRENALQAGALRPSQTSSAVSVQQSSRCLCTRGPATMVRSMQSSVMQSSAAVRAAQSCYIRDMCGTLACRYLTKGVV